MSKKLVIIDGNSLVYRMFYGVRPMSSKKGVPTNAVYGLANILLNILENNKPDYIGVAFDEKKPTFRHKEYDEYKAGRLKMPEDLQIQFDLIQEMLDVLNIEKLSVEGYEADDIIGTIAKFYSSEEIYVKIVTGDRDAFQLVDDHISVLFTKKGISELDVIDEEAIENSYGIEPKDLIEVKALMGDKSDNIPGVVGVGKKTALKLIKEYKTLENVYDNIDSHKGKLKENLINDRENAFLSRHLATIITHVPIEFEIDELKVQDFDKEEAIDFFMSLDCMSIASRLGSVEDIKEAKNLKDFNSEVIQVLATDESALRDIVEECENQGRVYMTWYITHPGYNIREIQGFCLTAGGQVYYIKDGFGEEIFDSFLGKLLDSDLEKIVHLSKDMLVYCMNKDIELKNITFDTFITAYLLEPSENSYNLDALAKMYLDISILSEEGLLGKGKNKKDFDSRDSGCKDYLVDNLEVLQLLYPVLLEQLQMHDMSDLYYKIELPLIEVLASFEYRGFTINIDNLELLDKEYDTLLESLTHDIYQLSGREFNINSPKQLSVVLFEDLKLPVIKKTKTGYSTNAEVLEKLIDAHPIIEKILEYRSISKLSSTYIKGFKDIIEPDSNKLYSTFNQAITTTGRISSSEPNLQNIPVKLEVGRKIRKIFIPSKEDNVLVDADYSQIELRILAHLSGDETLINSFMNGEDIHSRTASEIFGTSLDEVTSIQRSHAKAINFGLIYGKQAYGLSNDLNISRKEAQQYIDMYFGRYPKVEKYMSDIVKEGKAKGYVKSIFGRIRYIPEINSRNKMIAKAGERLALNTPIQGSAADIIKIAMVRVYQQLKERGLSAKLILQVHDELIVDTPREEIEEVMDIVKSEMENAADLSVPLIADISVGSNWYEV